MLQTEETRRRRDRRISDIETLNMELRAWHTRRNNTQKGVDWQFTAEDARVKLKRLYTVIL